MCEKRRSSSDKIHREKTVKSNTMFLQSKGRNKENIYRKLCARSWSAEAKDCTVMEGTEITTEG